MSKRHTRKKGRLFNNSPRGTPRVKGTGYGSKEKARRTLKKIKGKPKALQKQIATTMYRSVPKEQIGMPFSANRTERYYRAKYHKYQTQGMRTSARSALFIPLLKGGVRNAMKIYKPFLRSVGIHLPTLKGGQQESWIHRSMPAYLGVRSVLENRSYPLEADILY